jgi:hypothetical protein
MHSVADLLNCLDVTLVSWWLTIEIFGELMESLGLGAMLLLFLAVDTVEVIVLRVG